MPPLRCALVGSRAQELDSHPAGQPAAHTPVHKATTSHHQPTAPPSLGVGDEPVDGGEVLALRQLLVQTPEYLLCIDSGGAWMVWVGGVWVGWG